MRILVTGANGFVGRHLTRHLSESGHTPLYYDIQKTEDAPEDTCFTGDLRDAADLSQLIAKQKPDACIHLGGIAFVPMGWQDPQLVYNVNLVGTINLLEAFRKHAPEARILTVSTGEIYGRKARKKPLKEGDRMVPANPYAMAKMAADLHALLAAERYNMHIMTARPDNHTGPGQSEQFVTASFAAQIAAIAQGRQKPLMRVGNLDNMRNFTDVRDVARAYLMLIEKGSPAKAYNIASGHPARIQKVLEQLAQIAGVTPQIEIDPARYRPTDYLPTLDTTRIRKTIGWQPEIPLDQTLKDIYQYALQSTAHE